MWEKNCPRQAVVCCCSCKTKTHSEEINNNLHLDKRTKCCAVYCNFITKNKNKKNRERERGKTQFKNIFTKIHVKQIVWMNRFSAISLPFPHLFAYATVLHIKLSCSIYSDIHKITVHSLTHTNGKFSALVLEIYNLQQNQQLKLVLFAFLSGLSEIMGSTRCSIPWATQ